MSKKFTKLFLGDVVKTVGSRVFRKLTTEEPVVEDELQGTWVFNNSIISNGNTYLLNFTYNSVSCSRLAGADNPTSSLPIQTGEYLWYYVEDSGYLKVYQSGWVSDEYKTITITSKLSEVTNGDDLLAWLKANATKQSATTPTLISFTIGGTIYQAEEGMEWASWVGSAYNIHGYFIEGIAIYDSDGNRIYYQPHQAANINIYGSDIILANGVYGTRQTTGGGSN